MGGPRWLLMLRNRSSRRRCAHGSLQGARAETPLRPRQLAGCPSRDATAPTPGNVEAARQALRPIDEFRAAASRRGNGASKDEPGDVALPEGAPAPDSPLPELPVVAED
jgi:hypothetical protein